MTETKKKKGRPPKNDLVGRQFGRWTALKIYDTVSNGTNNSVTRWLCKCTCGIERPVRRQELLKGNSQSCGCRQGEAIRKYYVETPDANRYRLPGNLAMFHRVLSSYTENAKIRNLDFNLDYNQFRLLVTTCCHYCGRPPSNKMTSNNKNQLVFYYNGIDRKNNNIGYTLENCVACCKDCNFFKKSLNYKEFLDLIERIYNHVLSSNSLSS